MIKKNIDSFNFSQIFTSQKNINSKFLNIFGLQILRYLLAKISFFISGFFFQNNDTVKNYYKDGIILIENFLSKKEFSNVHKEFLKIIDIEKRARKLYENSNKNSSIEYYLYEFEDSVFNKNNYPNLYNVLKNNKINNIFKFAERKKEIKLFMRLERVITKNELKHDDNAHWHVDTYHNTHKAWVYLTDINKVNGPFNYIVGSNKFSFHRLFWEYTNSLKTVFYKNFLSFFLDQKYSDKFEKKKIEILCKKNSFMIANTHGYHRRGDAKINQIRDGISFFTRENPFKII